MNAIWPGCSELFDCPMSVCVYVCVCQHIVHGTHVLAGLVCRIEMCNNL
jgi:hypothetical protein